MNDVIHYIDDVNVVNDLSCAKEGVTRPARASAFVRHFG